MEKKSKFVEIKTKPTTTNVKDYLNSIKDEQKRKDSFVLLELMKKASGEEPKIWGTSLIGFGNKRYKSPTTGREVDWFLIGFAPRKANLSLYLSINIEERKIALKKLGKHKTDGGCIYINKLEEIDIKILNGMIEASLKRK